MRFYPQTFTAAALAVTLALPAFADTTLGGVSLDTIQPDTSTYAERLAAAQPYTKEVTDSFNYKKMITVMWQPIAEVAAQKGHTLNDTQKQELDALYQKTFTAPLKKVMGSADKTMAKLFTLQEIKATSAFYATPVGKAIMAKMPEMMQEVQPQTMALVKDTMPTLLPEIKKIVAMKN